MHTIHMQPENERKLKELKEGIISQIDALADELKSLTDCFTEKGYSSAFFGHVMVSQGNPPCYSAGIVLVDERPVGILWSFVLDSSRGKHEYVFDHLQEAYAHAQELLPTLEDLCNA